MKPPLPALLAALALVLASSSAAFAESVDGVDELHAQARELAAQGKFADALPLFTRAAELEPEDYRGHSGRGSMLNFLHRYTEGLAAIVRAVELAPDNPMLRYNFGLSLAEVGRFDDALAQFDRAIVARPELPMPYADRAAVKMSLGRLDEALADCAAALKADSNYIWTRYYRGGIHYLKGDYVSAAADFAAVAQNQPGFSAARLWRAVAERRAGASVAPELLHTQDDEWPAPLLRYIAGTMEREELLAAARAQRVPDDDRRESAAHALIGLVHLFAGENDSAKAAFRRTLAFDVPRHFEQSVAETELRRLH